MNFLLDPNHLLSLFILITLEITLAGDNIIFLVTACSNLPTQKRKSAMRIGIFLAMITRLLFLALMLSATTLTKDLFSILGHSVSVRDLVLIIGGAFLFVKPIMDIHAERQEQTKPKDTKPRFSRFGLVLLQIMFVDVIFSIDSVITAIGVSHHYGVMSTAIIIAALFMLVASGFLSRLVHQYPVFKIFALSFLSLIGIILILRGLNLHVSSGYIYVPFVFALFTQLMLAYARIK
jgi:predicted tellurium resistance membrane protein TerC